MTNKTETTLTIDDGVYTTKLSTKYEQRKRYLPKDPNAISAYIPGIILKINVAVGQKVKWGDSLLILEAMKMKNAVTAPKDGIIKAIHVQEEQMVTKEQVLLELE